MMPEDFVEICATIKGRVQGVGFRATVRQLAVRLGIAGTVQNLDDGSVKVHAFGKKEAVREMLNTLKKTNGFIVISDIISEEVVPPHHYPDFKIVY